MKKPVRLLQLSMLLVAVFLMLGSVTYAWFAKVEKTSIIKFDTASLKVEADLYAGLAPNDPNYQLVTEALVFNDIVAGEIYYFKLEVKNIGSIDGKLSVYIDNNNLLKSTTLEEDIFLLEDDLNNSKNILFDDETIISNDKVLGVNDEVTVYFKIIISSNLTNDNLGDYLTIRGITIRLDQIRN